MTTTLTYSQILKGRIISSSSKMMEPAISQVLFSDFRAFPWIAAFDADNDGDIDPVYAVFGQPFRGGLRIIPNDDNNGFLPEGFLTFGLNDCEAIDHADLDGDGWQDVLSISSRDSTVYWSKNL